MRMPVEHSAEDQMPKSTASHVGSLVLVMAFSSTVLNMEQTVAL